MKKCLLVTGVSGFIGSNLASKLLENDDYLIVGIDNMNDYYDVKLKESRLEKLMKYDNFIFYKENICNKEKLFQIFEKHKPSIVVNLAAQAGVRYSITNPDVYIESNIVGFFNILEACRYNPVDHLIYASSSSVYGNDSKIPYSTDENVDKPVSLYAATKKSNELLAYSYSKLYGIPTTGLRFFTVYGPAGRPDMAYFSFTDKLINKEKIKIFNYGNCKRDFTYIDDIVEGIIKVIDKKVDIKEGIVPYKVYNIGNGRPVDLLEFVKILSNELISNGILKEDFNINDYMDLVPMQKGDVEVTYADTEEFEKDFGFRPKTSINDGLKNFAEWYKNYYMEV